MAAIEDAAHETAARQAQQRHAGRRQGTSSASASSAAVASGTRVRYARIVTFCDCNMVLIQAHIAAAFCGANRRANVLTIKGYEITPFRAVVPAIPEVATNPLNAERITAEQEISVTGLRTEALSLLTRDRRGTGLIVRLRR